MPFTERQLRLMDNGRLLLAESGHRRAAIRLATITSMPVTDEQIRHAIVSLLEVCQLPATILSVGSRPVANGK